jgi:hypothetical protein
MTPPSAEHTPVIHSPDQAVGAKLLPRAGGQGAEQTERIVFELI